MPKSNFTKTPAVKRRPLYSVELWHCVHHSGYSEITAYVEASGKREVVAKIPSTSGASAEFLSTYICRLINEHGQSAANELADILTQKILRNR